MLLTCENKNLSTWAPAEISRKQNEEFFLRYGLGGVWSSFLRKQWKNVDERKGMLFCFSPF
jgi:hypothetical protein